jgi:outer membrane lipoprotein SlyB
MKITKSKKSIGILLAVIVSVFMSACATDISSNSYSDKHVGETSRSYRATVVKVRKVKVGPDELGKNKAGALLGGVGGAVIGSSTGSGLGAGIGAVAGAIGGAYAEKAMKTQVGLEITVELKNGSLLTVVQGADVDFSRGEKVIIMQNTKGRSKIVKDDV